MIFLSDHMIFFAYYESAVIPYFAIHNYLITDELYNYRPKELFIVIIFPFETLIFSQDKRVPTVITSSNNTHTVNVSSSPYVNINWNLNRKIPPTKPYSIKAKLLILSQIFLSPANLSRRSI